MKLRDLIVFIILVLLAFAAQAGDKRIATEDQRLLRIPDMIAPFGSCDDAIDCNTNLTSECAKHCTAKGGGGRLTNSTFKAEAKDKGFPGTCDADCECGDGSTAKLETDCAGSPKPDPPQEV